MTPDNLPKPVSDALQSRGLYDPRFEHDACGLVFLPPDQEQRKICMDRFEALVAPKNRNFSAGARSR